MRKRLFFAVLTFSVLCLLILTPTANIIIIFGDAVTNINNGNFVNRSTRSNVNGNGIDLYLAPYVGDIDGGVDPDWFFFYDQLRQWHNDNNIPAGFSFFPRTIEDDDQFNQILADMYLSDNIELVLKGEGQGGRELDKMSYDEVKALLQSDINHFKNKMQAILGIPNIKLPVSYNQLYGNFTNTIRDAIHDLGFKIYFEMYVADYGYIEPLPDFDITQYSVSFTTDGEAGPETVFKPPAQIYQEILDFEENHMIYINGKKVVPTMCHQQDFMMGENDNQLNQQKWNTYITVLEMAKNDSRIQLLKPEEIYDLRHPSYPVVDSVIVFGSGGITKLNVTVSHSPQSPTHYLDFIEVNLNGTILTFPVSYRPENTFSVICNLGPITGNPTVTVRAHCNVDGYSQTSFGPIVVPEFQNPAMLLILLLVTSCILILSKAKLRARSRTRFF
jgi:hypothetical protein